MHFIIVYSKYKLYHDNFPRSLQSLIYLQHSMANKPHSYQTIQ